MDVHFHQIYLVLAFNPTPVAVAVVGRANDSAQSTGNTRERRRGGILLGGLEAAIPPRNNSTLSFCGCYLCSPPSLSLSDTLETVAVAEGGEGSILIPVYNLPTWWVCRWKEPARRAADLNFLVDASQEMERN